MKSFFRAAVVLVLAAAGWIYWQGGPRRGPDPVYPSYADTRGDVHSLFAPAKPAVIVLWVTPCPYCARALRLLDGVRRDYDAQDLDVVGFYLNQSGDGEIDRISRDEGHSIAMAQGQPTGAFVLALTHYLSFRAPGRDIYVLGKDGRYDAVDSSDLNVADAEIDRRVRALLKDKLGLKERASKS